MWNKSFDDFVVNLVPGSPPINVRARPVSSSTVVVQWEEPLTPNGIIRVRVSPCLIEQRNLLLLLLLFVVVAVDVVVVAAAAVVVIIIIFSLLLLLFFFYPRYQGSLRIYEKLL